MYSAFKCPSDDCSQHPYVGAGIVVKWFLISLYSKVKSKSAETALSSEMNIQDE